MKPLFHLIMLMLLPSLVWLTVSCSDSMHQTALDRAESVMEQHPDSALAILDSIDKPELISEEERARYAVLMSMALDKNCIDTTSFVVLQPAIDYYLESGNADQRLRTLYYQGCIYLNRQDWDNALSTFVKCIDLIPESHDSLTMARALVAQGYLSDRFYDFETYTNSYCRAAKIYKDLSRKPQEFDCLINALNGTIILSDKSRGDSLLKLCKEFENPDSIQQRALAGLNLAHIVEFGSAQDIKDFLESEPDYSNYNMNGLLNIARAYKEIGDFGKSKQILHYVEGNECDTLKFLAISVSTHERLGEYKESLADYRNFCHIRDSINSSKLAQKIQSINEKHKIELKAQEDSKYKSRIIWSCIGGIVFLVLIVIILLLLFRNNKSQKNLAIERAKTIELENMNLKSQREKLALENQNLQLEKDKKALEAENLANRVEMLENESESLKDLVKSRKEELPSEVRRTIQERIEMLNSLLAGYITANDQYEKPYDTWIKELTENTEDFMNSNRLAFQASHPGFIRYFEEHGLSESEINYVCLYAIGLNGKEVGNYMKKRSHVNTSSAIRKKLGLDKHETNIGIYVRRLLHST